MTTKAFFKNVLLSSSVPFVSFLPATLLSAKNINLKWQKQDENLKVHISATSNELMQAKGRKGKRYWKYSTAQANNPYDICFSAYSENEDDNIQEVNHGIVSLPFSLTISCDISILQIKKLINKETILLKDIENSTITNRDDILRHFLHTCPKENAYFLLDLRRSVIRNDEDWYACPQNHMGTDKESWGQDSYWRRANPTNMYSFNAGGQWLDSPSDWSWKCQGLQRSYRGSNPDSGFKAWDWDRPNDTSRYWGLWHSCNALNNEKLDANKMSPTEFMLSDMFYKFRNGNDKPTNGFFQPQQIKSYITEELYNDSKNLNVNKWTSWDDNAFRMIYGFYFCYKNFFDCIEVSLTENTPKKHSFDATIHFKYNPSLLGGKRPFSFYQVMFDPWSINDDNNRVMIQCSHPTYDDFGTIGTNDSVMALQRGSMCGIFEPLTYEGKQVNSTYTWEYDLFVDNPLIE